MAAHPHDPTPQQSSPLPSSDRARAASREHALCPEDQAVDRLLHRLELTGGARHRAVSLGVALVEGARARRDERPFLDAFLQEFGLSNQEGIALMCIAEALLRIPDDATADRLIAEQLATGDWSAHAGKSESLFVNASTWGLMLTGGILDLDPSIKADAAGWMRKLTRKAGEPLVRLAVRRAMRIIGGEFVVGRSIEEALERSAREPEVALCSFDMLGEGARTLDDADRYLKSYEHAIDVIGAQGSGRPAARAVEHLHQAVGARAALFAAAARASHEPAGAEGARARAARRGVRHPAHHRCGGGGPPGSVPRCDRGAGARSGHPRLAGSRSCGTGVLQARPGCHRLGRRDRALDRAPHDGAAGQGRVLGQRDQAQPGAGALRLSGLHAQGHDRCVLPRLRGAALQARRCDLPAVRHPQCTQHRLRSRARTGRRGLRIPAAPWHGAAAVRRGRPPGREFSGGAGVCAGGRAQGLAGLPRAPAARERRQYLLRESLHGRGGAGGGHRARSHHRARAAGDVRASEAAESGRALRQPAQLLGDRSRRPARAGIAPRGRRRAALRGAFGSAHAAGPRLGGRPRRCAGLRAAAPDHQPGRSARDRRSRARCHGRGDRTSLRCGRAGPARLGRTRRRRPGGLPRSSGGAAREVARRFLRAAGAGGGQDLFGRDRRSSRSGGFLPLLCGARTRGVRPARAARGSDGRAQRAVDARPGRVRLHQSVELPAGDLRGTGDGGARRRQCRGGEARRTDAADRRTFRRAPARGRRRAAGAALHPDPRPRFRRGGVHSPRARRESS